MKAVYVLNESQKEQLNKKKIKIKEEPSIGSFTSKDEGNLRRIYCSFFLTALFVTEDIKRWTGLSRIFDQSKVRTFEKTVIKELIRLILELYTRCYDLNTDMLCRLVMFTNPLSERSKQTLKNKLDIKAKEFIEKMEQFVQLPHQDQSLVKVYTQEIVQQSLIQFYFRLRFSIFLL